MCVLSDNRRVVQISRLQLASLQSWGWKTFQFAWILFVSRVFGPLHCVFCRGYGESNCGVGVGRLGHCGGFVWLFREHEFYRFEFVQKWKKVKIIKMPWKFLVPYCFDGVLSIPGLPRDHLPAILGIICRPGIICGPVQNPAISNSQGYREIVRDNTFLSVQYILSGGALTALPDWCWPVCLGNVIKFEIGWLVWA